MLERTEGGVDVARSYASTRDALHVVRKSGGLDDNGSGHAAMLSECFVIGHGIVGRDIPIMARLAKARRWSKR